VSTSGRWRPSKIVSDTGVAAGTGASARTAPTGSPPRQRSPGRVQRLEVVSSTTTRTAGASRSTLSRRRSSPAGAEKRGALTGPPIASPAALFALRCSDSNLTPTPGPCRRVGLREEAVGASPHRTEAHHPHAHGGRSLALSPQPSGQVRPTRCDCAMDTLTVAIEDRRSFGRSRGLPETRPVRISVAS
jgi:hypothetical protein